MNRQVENMIAAILAAACLATAGWQLSLRLVPRFVPVEAERPQFSAAIGGEVVSPGTYVLPWGARVEDLIAAAGGLTGAAETALVNPARQVAAGDVVHVPAATTPAGDPRISLNGADAWTLQQLPGVGPRLAERIMEGRPYHSAEQLRQVAGIGPVTWARLEPLVRP